MRIVLVAGRYWPAIGGVETYLRETAQALASRHEVVVVARSTGGDGRPLWMTHDDSSGFEPFDDGPVRVEPLVVPISAKLATAPLLLSKVPKVARVVHTRARALLAPGFAETTGRSLARIVGRADVVHSWSSEFIGVAALGLARRVDAPLVVTSFPHAGQYGDGPVDRWLYPRADMCLGLLETDATIYAAGGAPPEKITVVGVGTGRTGTGDAARLPAIEGPVVVFLGVRRAYKGHRLLLDALPILRSEVPNASVVFAGPGEPLPSPLPSGAVDAGVIDEVERAAWLERADLLCLPSDHEIFPVSFLEAWQHRTPVVGSDIDSLRELCALSGGGVVSERTPAALARTLADLLRDRERSERLAERGHRFAETYGTIEAATERHEAVYGSLTGRNTR